MRRLAAALLIVLGAGDVLACNFLLRTMQTAYAHWAESLRAQGWDVDVSTSEAHINGLGATLVLQGVSLRGGRAVVPGGIAWQAARLELSMSLLHPHDLRIAPVAEQHLRLAAGPPLVFSANELAATVKLGAGRPNRLDVVAEGLVAGSPRGGEAQALQIEHADLHLQFGESQSSRTATAVVLRARGIGLPDNGRWPLGATIGRLVADLALTSPVLSGAAPAEQARAWRDWGGALQVRQLALHWGPLDVSAHGDLHLDDKLQPEGAGTAQLIGGTAALAALAQGGTIPQGIAQTGQLVLGLIAHPAGVGDRLEVPLRLNNSTLSIGKLPLLTLSRLDWAGVGG